MNIEEAKKIVDKLSVDSDELWKIPMIPAHKVKALLDTLDQPKPEIPQFVAEWLEGLKKEFPDNLPNQLYHVTRQGWGNGLEYKDSNTKEMKTLYNCRGNIKKDLVNRLSDLIDKCENDFEVMIFNPDATFDLLYESHSALSKVLKKEVTDD